jgi:glycosyltransferase involved in cell wall biosynthesis
MNILYVSFSYVPSHRASSVHVMKMCGALARAGHDVRLIAKRPQAERGDDHAFYGVSGFALDKLPRPAWRGGGIVFSAAVLRRLLAGRRTTDLVYCRDVVGAMLAAELGMPIVSELHYVPPAGTARRLVRRLIRHRSYRGLVVISEALRRDLVGEDLVPPHAPVIVAHDAADPPAQVSFERDHVRPRIGYVGNLYTGRGIELIVDVARRLPACDFELIGGSAPDLATWRSRALPPNVVLAGFVAPAELPARYRSFDVVLMPYPRSGIGVASGASDTSRWCSPMKMFEYMASGTPIVASDLPVLGEILHDGQNALIAGADDAAAWQRAIEAMIADRGLSRRLAERAYQDLLREHTWDRRVQKILKTILGQL